MYSGIEFEKESENGHELKLYTQGESAPSSGESNGTFLKLYTQGESAPSSEESNGTFTNIENSISNSPIETEYLLRIPKTEIFEDYEFTEIIPDNTNDYATLYVNSNSPMASNCNSDVEDGYNGSEHSYHNKKYKKFTYEDIENSLSKYYDQDEKVGTETDVLITYLKGVQLLYKQSKNITQIKFYLLIMSTLSITICISIIAPFIHDTEWGAYLITAGNALATILIAISRYLCLETYITNYGYMNRQYNRLETLLDFEHSREIFMSSPDAAAQFDATVSVPINMNFSKGLNLQEAEQRMNEIKEFFGELVPEDIIRLFPLIHNTNIFRFIKKMEQYKRNLIIRFRDIKNEIHFILHKSNSNENEPKTPKQAREKKRIMYLMELKEKTKSELIQCKHTYTQMDELFNKEIRYAETHQSCFGCAGWFRPDYDFSTLTPALKEYLKLVVPD